MSSGNTGTSDTVASTRSESNGAVEETANNVIKGKYGNGVTRKHKLGSRYVEVQKCVNEMYRNGLVR